MPSEGSAEDGLLSGVKIRNKCGHPKCRSEEMDLLDQTCFPAAGKYEENQHPNVKLTGFVTALSGRILLLSKSMKALSEFSCWLCSFLDKWLLTFKSQKGGLSLNEAFQKVRGGKKRKAELFQSISKEAGALLLLIFRMRWSPKLRMD